MNLALVIICAVFIIGIIPLYISVKIMGGEASLLRVLGAKLIGIVIGVLMGLFLGMIGGIISLVAMIFIYKFLFDLGFIRAIIAWLIEGAIMIGLIVLAVVFLGVSMSRLSLT